MKKIELGFEEPEIILKDEKGNLGLEIIKYKGSFFYNLYEKMNDEFKHITEGYLQNLDNKKAEYLDNPHLDLLENIWAGVLNPLEDVV
jgi:hypothetical protein